MNGQRGMKAAQLVELSHQLRTQDNAYTADPIFLVQEEELVYGFDSDYAEEYHWYFPDDGETFEVPEDGEGLPLSEDEAEKFGYEKIYFHRQWVFKCAHLTLKAANQYIENQRHNLKNPRVYVDSMHRCPEMIAIREFLMGDMAPALLVARSLAELKANAHKGDYATWVPSPEDLKSELHHHANKYLAACDAGDLDEVAEHLADLFNYLRKGWELVETAKQEQGVDHE